MESSVGSELVPDGMYGYTALGGEAEKMWRADPSFFQQLAVS